MLRMRGRSAFRHSFHGRSYVWGCSRLLEVKIVNNYSTAQKLLISVTYQYLIFNQFQELKLDFGICFRFLLPFLFLNSKYPRWKSKYLIQSISTY